MRHIQYTMMQYLKQTAARSRALTPRSSSQSRTEHRSTRQAARSRRTAMYGTRLCWLALMTLAGSQEA